MSKWNACCHSAQTSKVSHRIQRLEDVSTVLKSQAAQSIASSAAADPVLQSSRVNEKLTRPRDQPTPCHRQACLCPRNPGHPSGCKDRKLPDPSDGSPNFPKPQCCKPRGRVTQLAGDGPDVNIVELYSNPLFAVVWLSFLLDLAKGLTVRYVLSLSYEAQGVAALSLKTRLQGSLICTRISRTTRWNCLQRLRPILRPSQLPRYTGGR